jgi:hypothetical protein
MGSAAYLDNHGGRIFSYLAEIPEITFFPLCITLFSDTILFLCCLFFTIINCSDVACWDYFLKGCCACIENSRGQVLVRKVCTQLLEAAKIKINDYDEG